MAYKKIKSYQLTEEQMRQIWADEYCDKAKPIITFDDILVSFYPNMFNHCFYESANRQAKDKSLISLNRLEKILWIKDTLQDPTALLKQGWDKDEKKYVNDRRVAFVKNNYIVIIRFTGTKKASFVTAYELQEDDNIAKIKTSPQWENMFDDKEKEGI
jgi:hypothetical protein